jgi:hypothetical protein
LLTFGLGDLRSACHFVDVPLWSQSLKLDDPSRIINPLQLCQVRVGVGLPETRKALVALVLIDRGARYQADPSDAADNKGLAPAMDTRSRPSCEQNESGSQQQPKGHPNDKRDAVAERQHQNDEQA